MLRPATAPPRLTTLIFLSALSVATLSMFLPSLAHIAEDLEADYALVNLSLAGYTAMTAVLQLVMGPLSDRFGRRPVVLASLGVFIVASVGCAFAQDVWTFLGFRMAQGVIVSGHAVALAIVRDSSKSEEAASRIGYLTMAWAAAPLLGPMFGGLVDSLVGWRGNFWAFTIFGAAVLALCWTDLGETNTERAGTFGAQLRAYPELFRSRRFWGYAVCMAFSIGAFHAFLGGAPLVAVRIFGMSPAMLGLAIGSMTLGFMFGSFLSGRYARRFRLTTMTIAGRGVACVGVSTGIALVLAGVGDIAVVFGACIFVGLGNGLTIPSASAGAMSVRPGLAGSAAGLAGALGLAGGAFMSALTGAVVTAENGAWMLLAMMLLSTLIGLAAALYVLWVNMRDPLPAEK